MVWGRVVLLAGIAGLVGFVLGGLASAALGLGWLAFGLPLGLTGGALAALAARQGFDERTAKHQGGRLPRGLRRPMTRLLAVGRTPRGR